MKLAALTFGLLSLTAIAFAESPTEEPAATPTPTPSTSTPAPVADADEGEIEIKYFAQAQPKPMGLLPSGWDVGVVEDRTVEKIVDLPGGKNPRINSKAYVLIPTVKDGVVFDDPGFDVEMGNAQDSTVGASLTAYIEAASDLKKKLDVVTEELRGALENAGTATAKTATSKKKTSD